MSASDAGSDGTYSGSGHSSGGSSGSSSGSSTSSSGFQSGLSPGDTVTLEGEQLVLDTRVGAGAYGEIFQVGDLVLKATDDDEESFTAQRACSHPHVLELLTYGELDGSLMGALLPGCLCSAVTISPMQPTMVRRFRRGISQALAHVHALGWTHCDVKPENVLLNTQGQFVLTDFGNAHRETREEDAMTTLEYRSPEAILDGKATGYSDQWAFAVSLFDISTEANLYELVDDDPNLSHLLQIQSLHGPIPEAICRKHEDVQRRDGSGPIFEGGKLPDTEPTLSLAELLRKRTVAQEMAWIPMSRILVLEEADRPSWTTILELCE